MLINFQSYLFTNLDGTDGACFGLECCFVGVSCGCKYDFKNLSFYIDF